jgi:hypothetical protein
MFDVFAKSTICSLFVIPAPYQVRDKLQQESSNFRLLWTPAPRSARGRFRGSDSIFDFLREHQTLKLFKKQFPL